MKSKVVVLAFVLAGAAMGVAFFLRWEGGPASATGLGGSADRDGGGARGAELGAGVVEKPSRDALAAARESRQAVPPDSRLLDSRLLVGNVLVSSGQPGGLLDIEFYGAEEAMLESTPSTRLGTPVAPPSDWGTILVEVTSKDAARRPIPFRVEVAVGDGEDVRRVHSDSRGLAETLAVRVAPGKHRVRLTERTIAPCAPYDPASIAPRQIVVGEGAEVRVSFEVEIEEYIALQVIGAIEEPMRVRLRPEGKMSSVDAMYRGVIRYLPGGGYEASVAVHWPASFYVRGGDVGTQTVIELVGVQSKDVLWSGRMADIQPVGFSLPITARL